MGKSRMDISEKENRWGNQEWTFQRKKTDRENQMGKSRMDISERENRWGNQEWTFQREKTDGEIKNGHFRNTDIIGSTKHRTMTNRTEKHNTSLKTKMMSNTGFTKIVVIKVKLLLENGAMAKTMIGKQF
jgi:hypothetical protein